MSGTGGGPFDVQHSLDASEELDHLLEVLDILDFDSHVDAAEMIAVRPGGFDVRDVRVDRGDPRADIRQDPLAILDLHRQPHDIARGIGGVVPFHLDSAIGIVQQVRHVRTCRRMNRDTLAAGDVADD